MPAPVWRWSTAASLTVEYQAMWLTAGSRVALIRIHFEISSSDGLCLVFLEPPVLSSSFQTPPSFFFPPLIIERAHYWLLVYSSDGDRGARPQACSLFNVCRANIERWQARWHFLWAMHSLKCVCLDLCFTQITFRGWCLCGKRKREHQQVLVVKGTFVFFFRHRSRSKQRQQINLCKQISRDKTVFIFSVCYTSNKTFSHCL